MKKNLLTITASIVFIILSPMTVSFAEMNQLPSIAIQNPSTTNVQSNLSQQSNQSLNRIAAVVNDDVITEEHLEQLFFMTQQQFKANNTPIDEATLKKQVLDQLINQKIELQLAKQNHITATDAEINQAIEHIATQNHLTPETLKQKIIAMGMSWDGYRQQLRDQVIITKTQEKAVGSTIAVNAKDVSEFKKKFLSQDPNAIYHVADLLIPASTPQENTQALQKAQTLRNQLKNGNSFEQYMNSNAGGDLGYRRAADLPPIFVKPVAALKVNEISAPIHAPNGYHLLKLLEKKSQIPNLTQAQLQNLTYQQKLEAAVEKWLGQVRKSAYIKINSL